MRVYHAVTILVMGAGLALPATASTPAATQVAASAGLFQTDMRAGSATSPKAPGRLECVPYARMTSGIQIYGDAHTWWGQARGRYATGNQPRVGAVMAIRPFNNSHLGHVATVSRVVDSRTILLSHANWSVPGGIERNVTALDVSPRNDWSQVRIWYAPVRGLGTTHWPVAGFIYNAKPGMGPSTGPATKMTATPLRYARLDAGDKPAKASRQDRRRDPIGAIIAGTY